MNDGLEFGTVLFAVYLGGCLSGYLSAENKKPEPPTCRPEATASVHQTDGSMWCIYQQHKVGTPVWKEKA